MKNMAEEIAISLLEVSAVQFNFNKPFTWSSGWQSPIYCDCRLTLSYPKVRKFITEGFLEIIKKEYPDITMIAGVATAGIPQACFLAENLDLPLCYVRSKAKGHGKENLIEGKLNTGDKVLVIEDIISTGGSSLQAVDALRESGAEVLGVLAILTYGFEESQRQFEEKKVALHTLSDYTSLLVEYSKKQDISEDIMASLHEWRRNPSNWNQ